MENDEISVFIVEDKETALEIIEGYFQKDKLTYAAIFKKEDRSAITHALDHI